MQSMEILRKDMRIITYGINANRKQGNLQCRKHCDEQRKMTLGCWGRVSLRQSWGEGHTGSRGRAKARRGLFGMTLVARVLLKCTVCLLMTSAGQLLPSKLSKRREYR